jgi:hypothetical protein
MRRDRGFNLRLIRFTGSDDIMTNTADEMFGKAAFHYVRADLQAVKSNYGSLQNSNYTPAFHDPLASVPPLCYR